MLVAKQQWQAFLKLGFTNHNNDRTTLSYREHYGPMLVQRALYPEGNEICHVTLLHPPSGIAGGDSLEIEIDVDNDARAVLNTPGATRWYKSNGKQSRQEITINVAADARLDWLPQENIFFEDTNSISKTKISLASSSRAIGWEICQLGSILKDGFWDNGKVQLDLSLSIDGNLFWVDKGIIDAADPVRSSISGLDGLPVFATMWCFGRDISKDLNDTLASMMIWNEDLRSGITVMSYKNQQSLYLVRCIGLHAEDVRNHLIAVWEFLRLNVLETTPNHMRIWST